MKSVIPQIISAAILCLAPSFGIADDAWRAGAASSEITPVQPMWMAGYSSRNRPAEGKLTELWAKAIVLADEHDHRALLITLDVVGIDRTLSTQICNSLEETYGLKREQIAICTSHTHSGPVVGQNLAPLHYMQVDGAQKKLIDQYANDLHDKVVGVVGEAIDALQPCSLSWANASTDFAVNRRNNAEAEAPVRRAENLIQGPFDHDVPVLAIRKVDGELLSIVFGYACHATVLSGYQWSGDYPGVAQAELEASHPGCIALFFAGCGADQNPLPRRTTELAQHYGRRLATAVDKVLFTTQLTPVDGGLSTHFTEIELELDALPSPESIQRDTQSDNPYTVARALHLQELLKTDKALSPTYPYPISVWKIGEIQWVFLGGEVVVDYALRLKLELNSTRTWVAGYSNDVMAYIPSRRVLREGGYEGGGAMVYYGLPTVWAPTVEESIVQAVRGLLK